MRRVLIGGFGEIPRLGLRDLLRDRGFELVAEAGAGAAVVPCLNEARPDVVVLDLDDDRTMDVAAVISREFPAIKVVAFSSEQPVMRVFPAFHHGESYSSPLSREFLASALEH